MYHIDPILTSTMPKIPGYYSAKSKLLQSNSNKFKHTSITTTYWKHLGWVFEVVLQILLALKPCERELADLWALEDLPSSFVELLVKVDDVGGVDEIDERVADVGELFCI